MAGLVTASLVLVEETAIDVELSDLCESAEFPFSDGGVGTSPDCPWAVSGVQSTPGGGG